jgi:hypothetical protein
MGKPRKRKRDRSKPGRIDLLRKKQATVLKQLDLTEAQLRRTPFWRVLKKRTYRGAVEGYRAQLERLRQLEVEYEQSETFQRGFKGIQSRPARVASAQKARGAK